LRRAKARQHEFAASATVFITTTRVLSGHSELRSGYKNRSGARNSTAATEANNMARQKK
jgi:hypothetical protein